MTQKKWKGIMRARGYNCGDRYNTVFVGLEIYDYTLKRIPKWLRNNYVIATVRPATKREIRIGMCTLKE